MTVTKDQIPECSRMIHFSKLSQIIKQKCDTLIKYQLVLILVSVFVSFCLFVSFGFEIAQFNCPVNKKKIKRDAIYGEKKCDS